DELTIGAIVWSTWPLTVGPRAERVRGEMEEAHELFADSGWLESPRGYFREPPPLENPVSLERRYPGHSFEQISFESGYEPWPGEPGRDRWLSYERNRTAHAWVLRHPGEPRPWLVCVHGIRMGSPWKDLTHFKPSYLHEELGLNLVFPVLPIHGPRRVGLVSGGRILTGDLMDTLHAASQAMWDIRRLLGWLELQEAPAIGALGHSLGGYSAALLSCLDDRLDCVVVGNPATDFTRLFWRNTPALAARYMQHQGVWRGLQQELTKVISPLELDPLLPRERRAIFGGVADRVVPISETNGLWQHWGKPRISWYEGTHRGFLREPEARQLLKETLGDAGMLRG
ncbi:MAG: YqiA/YcfP family alpha/beta fold hydrolase, partial [Rubrobacteraceae bacterium]